MTNPKQTLLQFTSSTSSKTDLELAGLQTDHRQFLDALQEEWLLPTNGQEGRILGLKVIAETVKHDHPTGLIGLWLYFNLQLLPNLTVPVLSEGVWKSGTIRSLDGDVECIFWPGPIPLFALNRVVLESGEERARLLGLIKQVSNATMPDVEIVVQKVDVNKNRNIESPKIFSKGVELPVHYDQVRGAATMAVWAVPRVDPWFDLLLACLSGDIDQLVASVKETEAPHFLESPLLRRSSRSENESNESFECQLWNAALRAFDDAHLQGGIDLKTVIERIEELSGASSDLTKDSAAKWRSETLLIMGGAKDFRLDDWRLNKVGKALQLAFLRPEPDSFAKWLNELPGLPPAVWLSAAMLCGYLQGYRRLPVSFRGGAIQRRMLAIRAYNVTSIDPETVHWPTADTGKLTWHRDKQDIVINWSNYELVRKQAHPRTSWYKADLEEPKNVKAAEKLAKRLSWECFIRHLELSDTTVPIVAHANSDVSVERDMLTVHGKVRFNLPSTASITEALDQDAFRKCLAVEGAENIQSPPVEYYAHATEIEPVLPTGKNGQCRPHAVILGLIQGENYITPQEEADIVGLIDAREWINDMKRRVQHYGWRYDYKARKIDRTMRLGTLPPWASRLAERLAHDKLLPEIADQVIVNEYIGNQGISKHVDCVPCFENGIAMISLLESWEMIFWQGRDTREAVLLPRRSVTILSGDARYIWMHEIPKRKMEPTGLRRERRISLTFRKVKLDK